jgi:hypothetical protein
MSYAVRKDGQGWRAVNSLADVDPSTETYSDAPPQTNALDQARIVRIGAIYGAYMGAIASDVTITTAGGVTKAFQADARAIANLQAMLAAFPSGPPAGFYWVSSDNTQVPFTLADMKSLAAAMGAQGWSAFQHLQALKASISNAATVAAVQAVVW